MPNYDIKLIVRKLEDELQAPLILKTMMGYINLICRKYIQFDSKVFERL